MTKPDIDLEKDDRQIRLWGPHGQASIQSAKLYVLGSDCQATEFLKTMVLHGVRDITIVDDAKITADDIATNFFITPDTQGQPRAPLAATLLKELNPSAKIRAVVAPAESLPGLSDLGRDSIVVTTGKRTREFLTRISGLVTSKGVRQVHFQTTGFFGAFYLDGGLHGVYEGDEMSKSFPNEIRILNPWPELQAFWDSFNFSALTDTEHGHLLYFTILNRANLEVRKELGVPKLTNQHRPQLERKIESYRRPKPDADPGSFPFLPAECIDEALANIAFAYGTPSLPPNPSEIFRIFDAGLVPANTVDPFWQLARATYNFTKKHGVLPHYGGCPDCEALPAFFQAQKKVYREKSAKDWKEVLADKSITVRIDPEFAKRFAENVCGINGFVYDRIGTYLDKLPGECWDPSDLEASNALACVQLLFIAARNFLAKNRRNPGNAPADVAEIKAELAKLNAPEDVRDSFAVEFCRYNGTVLPSIVASFAAVLAGEVTKLIIHQAIPARGVVIYDGLHGQLRQAN